MVEVSKKSNTISKEEARQFLVNYHNFNGSKGYSGQVGALEYLKKVRSIQYDPLNVVGRNADLVLQSKVKDYKPEMLQTLLYKDRLLIDGFDKEMCIYLMEDFLKFEKIREATGKSTIDTLEKRGQLDALEMLEEVREFITNKGAIGTKDINIEETCGNATSDPVDKEKNRWGHKKLSSAALDYLYTIGELCVVSKNGINKTFDITKRILTAELSKEASFHNQDEFLSWYIKRRIGSVGLLWDKNGGAWQGHFLSDKRKREEVLLNLCEAGEITQLYVEDIKIPFYTHKEETLFIKPNQHKQVKFLAPLDNMIWDREMTGQLFNFEYRWEVYTPVIKRKYGYYVLPVLYDNKLIARFEPEKVTKNMPFHIKNWWWESGTVVTEELLSSIHIAIHDFCRYLGVEWLKDYNNIIMEKI